MHRNRQTSSNPSILVTGASTGIGRACAVHLDSLGFVVFAGVRKHADGDSLTAEAPNIRPVIIDVTDAESIAAAAAELQTALGPDGLFGLVNNAGITVVGPLESVRIEDLRRQLEVNVVGQIAVTQAFLPQLRQAKGRIVNMGSIFGLMSLPYVGAYAASKYALEALTDALRSEVAPWGIEVVIIEPGRIATPIFDKSMDAMEEWRNPTDETQALYADSMAATLKVTARLAKSCASPQHVAHAVARAFTARRPKTRYKVGRDVRFWTPLRRVLPDRLCDWVIRIVLATGA
ncbi:MAG TPA: SDR family oxidoreductase [Candidatus Hydrogenedentes bacterium]|nr:SDR family oxidoreductase [Candidatus Hydrogenedentota bacterium]